MTEPAPIVYTDLDGTLLDHESYDFSPVLPLSKQMSGKGVPIVFCTSKTFSEVIHLRAQLGNQSPFIVENGAAVYLPKTSFPESPPGAESRSDYWCYSICPPREKWLEAIDQLAPRFDSCFRQFSKISAEQVKDLTGLSLEEAERARAREFGEPLQWLGSDEELTRFSQLLTAQGANILIGGRFVHVAGQADKGVAMTWLTQQFERMQRKPLVTIALGDSQNDAALLNTSDYAVAVKSPVQDFPKLEPRENLYYTQAFGPHGWVEGLEHCLRALKFL